MAEKLLYVELEESESSGYCSVENCFRSKKEVEDNFRKMINTVLKWNGYSDEYFKSIEEVKDNYKDVLNSIPNIRKDYVTLEQYLENFIPVRVKYDGRKRGIHEEDILKSLAEQGIIEKVSEGGMFGGYYKFKKSA